MFDLEAAIAGWRREMAASGLRSAHLLDELESHLRDDFAARLSNGMAAGEAFAQALKRMGEPKVLSREFRRSHPMRSRGVVLKVASGITLYVLVVLGLDQLFHSGILPAAYWTAETAIWTFFFLVAGKIVVGFFNRRKEAYFDHELWLTPQAQRAVEIAREEGTRFDHNFVGTEHLLLGLLKLEKGGVQKILSRSGIDRTMICTEIENLVGVAPFKPTQRTFPATLRLKTALRIASREAREANRTGVDAEFILLGLLLEGNGVAARVLKKLGITPEKLRDEINAELSPPADPDGSQTD